MPFVLSRSELFPQPIPAKFSGMNVGMVAVLNRLMSFALEASLSVLAWVVYCTGSSLSLINASLCAFLAFTTTVADIVHIHATHGIFVIGVGGFNIFVDLSNQTHVLPPRPYLIMRGLQPAILNKTSIKSQSQ